MGRRRKTIAPQGHPPTPAANEPRPEHVEIVVAGRVVCKVCFNVKPISGVWRMKCRRKQASGFLGEGG